MDNPFDQVVINPRERPLSSDINLAQSQLAQTIREVFLRSFQKRTSFTNPISQPPASPAFLGDGFLVTPTATPSAAILINPGLGFLYDASDEPLGIGGIVGVDDVSPIKPFTLTSGLTIPMQTPFPPGQDRTDIIEVYTGTGGPDRRLENPLTRDVLDPVAGVFNPTLVNKTLAFNQNGRYSAAGPSGSNTAGIGYKYGTPAAAGTSTPPANTAGYVTIATIVISSGVTTIAQAAIADNRALLAPNNILDFWISYGISTVSQVAPTLNAALLPPGLAVAIVAESLYSAGQHSIYVFGAGQALAQCGAADSNSAAFLPNFRSNSSTGVVGGGGSSLTQAQLTSYGIGAINQPNGAPYVRLYQNTFVPISGDGGLPTLCQCLNRFALSF